MTKLDIGLPPVSAGRTRPATSRRDFMRLAAALSAASLANCAPSGAVEDSIQVGDIATTADGRFALWPTDVTVPTVDHPGYGYHVDYFDIGETGPWPKILGDDHKRQLEKFADLILPATETAPPPSEVGIADFFDDWTSAPYPWMNDTRKTVHQGFAWLDLQSRLMFDKDWLDLDDDEATQILDIMAAAEKTSGPLTQAAWMYGNLRELVIGAYYTTPEGEADLGHIHAEPISGDYPGPTGDALAHIRQTILDAGLDWDDLPVGPPVIGGAP